MPYNSQTLIESCSGTIYDTGGPDGNYLENSTSVLTIHSPGASSIVLNILEFDIEAGGANSCDYDYIAFYNGNSTNSTLINSTYYCNTTGNPGTISSTGEYITIEFFSDSYVNHSGFKIQYSCVGNQIPPTIFFTADKTYSCDGLISFTDNSYNNPESWEWNFGDGNTSTEQNPDHQYAANGVYPVRLSATNSFGTRALLMSEYITVNMPEAPEIGNILACNNRNFGINVEFEGEAQWYSDINDPLPVYSGNSWVHAPISNNTVYYVRETFNEAEYNVGPVNNTNNGSYFGNLNSIHYLVFDVYSDFVLESVLVNAQGNGNRIISIKNNINEIIDQKTIYIPNGVSRITLNFEIPEGTNYKLVGEGEPYLFRSDNTANLNYPYNIENIVSIKYSSAIGYETSYYYYFYDWKIKTIACKSEFTTVELNPVVCEDVYIEDINPDTGDISVFPNPGNGIFKIYGLENIITNNITITDISGRIITEYKNFSGNIIDLTNVPEGLYFVNIYNPEIHKTIKITNLKL
ncbi:MAG: T9SS type A sorting domain-containing protein [Bacteroidales bacterium]|nr:T9SS type A sorting domain-containing protein [Bacteroidales bacterium]